MRKLMHILPFMDSDELKDLAYKVMNEEIKGVRLIMVFPFLNSDDLSEIVDKLIENKQGKYLNHALPFVSRKTVKRIFEGVKSGEIEGVKPTSLYPFLGKEDLKELFDKLIQDAIENPEEEDEDDEDELFTEDFELEVESVVENSGYFKSKKTEKE